MVPWDLKACPKKILMVKQKTVRILGEMDGHCIWFIALALHRPSPIQVVDGSGCTVNFHIRYQVFLASCNLLATLISPVRRLLHSIISYSGLIEDGVSTHHWLQFE